MKPPAWPPQELHVQLTISENPENQRPGIETGWLKKKECVCGGVLSW